MLLLIPNNLFQGPQGHKTLSKSYAGPLVHLHQRAHIEGQSIYPTERLNQARPHEERVCLQLAVVRLKTHKYHRQCVVGSLSYQVFKIAESGLKGSHASLSGTEMTLRQANPSIDLENELFGVDRTN